MKLDPWGLFHCLAHDHKSTQEFNYHVISSSSWSLNSKVFILRPCSHMWHKCKCKCKKYMGELHQCIYKHKCKRQLKVLKKFHFLALATALANTRIKKWFHATMAQWSWKHDGLFHFWREIGREYKEIYVLYDKCCANKLKETLAWRDVANWDQCFMKENINLQYKCISSVVLKRYFFHPLSTLYTKATTRRLNVAKAFHSCRLFWKKFDCAWLHPCILRSLHLSSTF